MKLFKLKRKNIILVSLLAITGFLGISSIAVNTATSKEAPVAEKAEAASHNVSTRIWFNTGGSSSAGWGTANATLYSWTWYSGYSKYHKLQWVSEASKYYIDLEGAATGLTLCRASKDYSVDGSTSWNDNVKEWGKQDASFGTTSTNMLDISNSDTSQALNSWSEYKILTNGTTIYLHTGGENSGWAADSAKISAWCWKTNGAQWVHATWDSSSGYYVFNLPANGVGFTLYRGSTYRTGTTWAGGGGTQYNVANIIYDTSKKVLDTTDVPGTLVWSYLPDSYIYYVNASSSPTGDYIYSWGSSEYFGSWPGKLITSVYGVSTVQGDVKFNGTSSVLIYKIPYSTLAGDTGVKFRGGDDSYQTANFTLASGSAYIWETTASNKDSARGDAIDLLLTEESYRKGATNESICNISNTNCASLYSTYNSLGSDAKAFVNNSYTLTYPSSSTSASKVDVSFEKIFHQIGINGGAISKPLFAGLSLFGSEDNFSTIIIIISSSVALLSVTALSILVIRKRKSKED